MTTKHRVFCFLDGSIIPDDALIAIASDDAFYLGVLSSQLHVTWALAAGGTLEDRPRYNKTHCFDPFPFPDASPVQRAAIAALAEELDALRRTRLDAHPQLTMTGLFEAFIAAGLVPVIPGQGSVGASGDLAPLAHLTAALMGVGEVFEREARVPAGAALARAGLEPLTLGPKEGLALLNGTQISTALALAGAFEAERMVQAALVTGALATDAARGSDTPFDPRIHAVRRHRGQIAAAASLRALLQGSAIRASHLTNDERVQDPYCLRCQPQVLGAILDLLEQAAATLQTEANGVSNNPLVFPDTGEVVSGGNFHAEPVAFAADMIALALCEIGSLADRRVAMLVDPALSGLPAFLTPRVGPFRWVALSGDPEDIYRTDAKVKELLPANHHLHYWLDMARSRIRFQGLPARICWVGLGDRHRLGLAFNEMVASGEVSAPIVIGRDHLDSGSIASPNRETEAMLDGSDAVSDWPLLNALLNTASGATWVSLHHGGGVGMGFSQHAGMVIVADGTQDAG